MNSFYRFIAFSNILFNILIVCLNAATVNPNTTNNNSNTFAGVSTRLPIYKQRCNVPLTVDPFDKSIAPYIKTKEPNKCHNNFFYADLELKTGVIRPNYSIIKEKDCQCFWNALKIIMKHSDSNGFIFKDFLTFDSPIDMIELRKKKNTDLVLIKCRCGIFKFERSAKLFSYPNFKIDNRREKAPIQVDEKLNKTAYEKVIKKCPVAPNVVVIVIESLSYLNYKRHMKRTQQLFAQHFNSTLVEFESVIKVGENSYPNMITLITGKPPRHYRWPYGVASNFYYDNEPIIWKHFEKRRGYYTGYVEDMPTFGIFNWVGKGFKTKNADYFNRNYFCALNAYSATSSGLSAGCKPSSNQCYSGRSFLDQQFEQIESMMLRMDKEKQNYFIYADPGYLTHDDFNMASVMDHHTSRFISRNYELLKDSVLLFLGDHGNRYGIQMRSWVGRMESSWPYLAINVPESMQKKYPHIMPIMRQNAKRLVTWIDVHHALFDLANCDLKPKRSKNFKLREPDPSLIIANTTQIPPPNLNEKRTNYSLFNEVIPNDRSCEEALIPSPFCICLPRQKLSNESFEAHRAGEEFINQLNKLLEIYKKECHELKLSKIIDVSKLYKEQNAVTYDMVIEANPSKAVFRGELSKYTNNEWSLNSAFERFNKYGKQGDCIPNKNLRKVCYCKKQ